ncbi:MAG: DUF2085 domain-containing protein [Coprobacillus sp.]
MNNLFDFILYRLAHLGEIPLCNGNASRAPFIFGYCFPLCYRCTFVVICFLITLYLCYRYQSDLKLGMLLLCLVPMILDGCIQTFWGIESTNLRRAITGGLFGYALGAIVYKILKYVNERL